MPAASASGADASNGSAPRNREHNQGNQDRKYTVEQKTAVLRIRRCQATAFYDILGLEEAKKTCTESDIKKAYRKQSLLTHPDKNGHEQADEAFKMVARAFSVLGDKEKREKFDRFGTDPDSRFGGQPQDPFAGFARRGPAAGGGMGGGGGGGGWEEEINPEELFARFFGGGFGGGGFDTGPQFAFNFGPGVRVHQFGGARPRGRPRAAAANGEPAREASLTSTLLGLLPILVLFVFPLLSSIFSEPAQPATPRMAFETASPPYTHKRVIADLKTNYFVNPKDIETYNDAKLHRLDLSAKTTFIHVLKSECENERAHQQRMVEDAQGWFFQDPEKMEAARNYDTKSCNKLRTFGYI